jgi:hypothetical protein
VCAVRAIEKFLPWAALRFELSADARPIALADRDRWLLAAAARGELPLISNDDEQRAVILDGWPAAASERVPAQLKVSAAFPHEHEVVHHAADILAAVGITLDASWGVASPLLTMGQIAQQIVLDHPVPGRPPPGLPGLAMPQRLGSPFVPHFLGWINYWSKETAVRIRFPDRARETELMARARPVEGGGWVVQLTDAPLDLSIPSHLEALRRAYEVLPAIGGRDASDPRGGSGAAPAC